MANVVEDRLSRRTKRKLRLSFIELMDKKDIMEITVTEISNLADVNRGTFYLHYSDIYDMRRQIETELIDELYTILSYHSAEKMKKAIYPIIFDVCSFFNENCKLLNIFLSKNGDMVFADGLKGIVKEKVFHDWKAVYKLDNAKENEIHFCFITSGIIGVLRQWIYEGCVTSIEAVASLLREMILNGSQFLEDKRVSEGSF